MLADEINRQIDSWLTRFLSRFELAFSLQFMLPFVTYWRVTALMLLGVVLYRSGFLSARLTAKTYLISAAACLSIGLTISTIGVVLNMQSKFDLEYSYVFGVLPNYLGSVFTSVGYAALIMLLAKSTGFAVVKFALRSVGKTAFSNYIMQSVLGIFVFSVLGYFGKTGYPQLMLFVVAVWVFQLVLSMLWVSRFRHGPLEKLWRYLTYRNVSKNTDIEKA